MSLSEVPLHGSIAGAVGPSRREQQRRHQDWLSGDLTPKMLAAIAALRAGPLKRRFADFEQGNGKLHLYPVVAALARRGFALIDKHGACLAPAQDTDKETGNATPA